MFVNTDCCLSRIQIFIKQFDSKSYVFNIYVVSSHKSLLSYTSSNLQIDVVHYVVNQQQQYGGVCTQRHLSRTLKFRISIPMQIPPPPPTHTRMHIPFTPYVLKESTAFFLWYSKQCKQKSLFSSDKEIRYYLSKIKFVFNCIEF